MCGDGPRAHVPCRHVQSCKLCKESVSELQKFPVLRKHGMIKEHSQSEVHTLCCASCNNSKNLPTVVMPIVDVLLHNAYGPIPNGHEQSVSSPKF